MKFMNNHEGKSQIFGRDGERIPMNLQFFAEGSGDGNAAESDESTSSVSEEETESDDGDASISGEVAKQFADYKAEIARLKLANDKSSREAATYKKQLQAKMSAEERAADAENERITALEEENKQMKAQMRMDSYSKRYMGIGMDEKTAESLSELTGDLSDVDKFFSTLDKFVKAKIKTAGENAVQELIKADPSIKAGSGSADKNAWVSDMAKELAHQRSNANTSILEKYM